MATSTIIQILLFTILLYSSSLVAANPTFNVKTYGAKSDGKSDCTKAFLNAWSAACATTAPATIYVPPGRFLLRSAIFAGNRCKNTAIIIRIDGTLVAPSDYNAIGNSGSWLKFERVTGVSIYGGTLDAQGTKLWACKNSGKSCPKGGIIYVNSQKTRVVVTNNQGIHIVDANDQFGSQTSESSYFSTDSSLAFYNSNNIRINGLASLNSQMFHILFHGCRDANVANVKISAPGNSPNTDGIHVQQSSGVTIMNSHVSTGDDCVSVGPGATNLWIENLACGPGHGISIGSLGWDMNEAGVQNVTVKTATFTGTENGVRVKTWARPSNGFVKDVLFQHVVMVNVQNPIIIDQNYCPSHQHCPNQASGVKISGITYEDVHGTSATQVAVKFDCSKTHPCSGITLDQVNLTFRDKPATASCANADGTADGIVKPSSCL